MSITEPDFSDDKFSFDSVFSPTALTGMTTMSAALMLSVLGVMQENKHNYMKLFVLKCIIIGFQGNCYNLH